MCAVRCALCPVCCMVLYVALCLTIHTAGTRPQSDISNVPLNYAGVAVAVVALFMYMFVETESTDKVRESGSRFNTTCPPYEKYHRPSIPIPCAKLAHPPNPTHR